MASYELNRAECDTYATLWGEFAVELVYKFEQGCRHPGEFALLNM